MSKKINFRTFYLSQENEVTYNKFKEICKRENESISEKIVAFMIDYVRVHEVGNPQKRLDVIIEAQSKTCSVCGALASRVHYTGKNPTYRCRKHYFSGKESYNISYGKV